MKLTTLHNHVDPQDRVHPAMALLDAHTPSLSGWYAEPMSSEQAGCLLGRVQQKLRQHLCRGSSCYPLHIAQLIAHFWSGRVGRFDSEPGVVALSDSEHALLELVYGQLLISRKLQPAQRYLASGLARAAPLLVSGDYCRLLRQHELLACLPLSKTPASAQSLQGLLREAAVIRRMRETAGFHPGNAHLDTLG